MSKANYVLVATFFLVVIALFVVTFVVDTTPEATENRPSRSTKASPTPVAQTTLSLSPNPLLLSASTSGSVDIMINTGTNEVTTVQVELAYDPRYLTNVRITEADFFTNPVELLNRIDIKDGRVSYALGIPPGQKPLKGQGKIATVTFNKLATASPEAETTLLFTPKTLVSAKGVGPSVVKITNGATITFVPQPSL